MIYSCTTNKVINKHKTMKAALKKAGDFGQVMDPESGEVWQSNEMADGSYGKFSKIEMPWSIKDIISECKVT